jgi:inorganic phosphate transporter, PiT family
LAPMLPIQFVRALYPHIFSQTLNLALIGALSALLAAALWVSFATWKSLPVSTTHSIVGAMIGFGIMAGGVSVINWTKLGGVVLSWVISPIFSMMISYLMLKIIIRFVISAKDSFNQALKLAPFFISLTCFVVVLSFLFKTPLGQEFSTKNSFGHYNCYIRHSFDGIFRKHSGKASIKKINKKRGAEEIFRKIQIGTSCYVALAQGANDVANAIGPLRSFIFLLKPELLQKQFRCPLFFFFLEVSALHVVFPWQATG